MKKYLKILIPALLISFLAFMGYKIGTKIKEKEAVVAQISSVPAFAYEDLNDKSFTNATLEETKSTLFIYFNSECDFCNQEAEMVQENIEQLKGIQIVFISLETKEKIKAFATQYKLLDYANIHFVCDTKASFASTFDVKSLPSLVLYNKNKELVEKIKGQVKVETILKKLEAGN